MMACMKISTLFALVLSTLHLSLPASDSIGTFADKLKTALAGDYTVTEQGQTISVLSVYEIDYPRIILEEISIPSSLKRRHIGDQSFKEWVEKGAKGHTSWTLTEIDLETKEVLECFSPSRNAWLKISASDLFITSLLELKMAPLPERQRRKIGHPPMPSEVDTRKLWNPPAFFEGRAIESPTFSAYQIHWPKDHSKLSGKELHMYFVDQEEPLPFPTWLQIKEGIDSQLRIQSLDAGKRLKSPVKTFLRRPPLFLSPFRKSESGAFFTMQLPKYYREISFYLVDPVNTSSEPVPLKYRSVKKGDETVLIELENPSGADLAKLSAPYQLIFETKSPIYYRLESKEPISWPISR